MGWKTWSPHSSARSTAVRCCGSAGSSGGSGTSRSMRSRIAREPTSFSPSSKRTAGTVRVPKRMRCSAACSGGGSSTTWCSMPFSSSARCTVAQGCEPWTT